MKDKAFYNQSLEELDMYQKLIQYWSMSFDPGANIYVLDNMNFDISTYPEIFTLAEVTGLYEIEPGYTSPDGFMELQQLIRQLELSRLLKNNPRREKTIHRLISGAGVGCGNGCTNVMNGILHSIIQLKSQKQAGNCFSMEVVLVLPNYTVYAAQLSNIIAPVIPKYILSRREHNFLPTFEQVAETVTDRTAAVVLTYPGNPAQSTYEKESIFQLKKLVDFCQQREIFLIVDNIYQDLIFPSSRSFTEIFDLTDSLDYVIKVYGCSKDTPFYAGYRTGYWFGDPAINEIYKYYISSIENSLNTHSLVFFALNLFFKMKKILNSEPTLEDMEYFVNGIFGWGIKVDKQLLLERFREMNLFQSYISRIGKSNELQERALKKAIQFVKNSRVFSDYVNQDIGNLLFIKVDDGYFDQPGDPFFNFIFKEAKCGILPGNVFGIPNSSGEVWFRITLLHDSDDKILSYLGKIEDNLIKHRRYQSFGI